MNHACICNHLSKCVNCHIPVWHICMHMKGLQAHIQPENWHMNIHVTNSASDSYFEIVTDCHISIWKWGKLRANESIHLFGKCTWTLNLSGVTYKGWTIWMQRRLTIQEYQPAFNTWLSLSMQTRSCLYYVGGKGFIWDWPFLILWDMRFDFLIFWDFEIRQFFEIWDWHFLILWDLRFRFFILWDLRLQNFILWDLRSGNSQW